MGLKLPSLAPLCFFLISVSYKLAFTAISSLLSQYSNQYGPDILLQLNVAYFFPSIPVLMLQTAFNDRMDRRLGLPGGALLRFMVGLGGLVALTRNFPQLTANSEKALLTATVMVGVSYGVAFGTSYQIASKFASGATVALTTGFVSSGPVVLLMDVLLKDGPFYSEAALGQLFRWVSLVTSGGLVAALLLVLSNWRMLAASGPGGAAAGGGKTVELRVSGGSHHHHQHPQPHRAPSYGSSHYGSSSVFTAAGGSGPHMRHQGSAPNASSSALPGAAGPGGSANGHFAAGSHHRDSHGHGHHAIMLDFAEAGGVGRHGGPSGGGSDYRDSYKDHGPLHSSLSLGGYGEGLGGSADESKVAKRDLPLLRLMARISPAALSISISVGTSMLIFPFFTYMQSTGLLGVRFAQVLFYIRLVGDIAGRMVPKRMQVTTVRGLMFWAFVKLALVPVLFGCIFTPRLTGGDVTAVLVVAVFWILSGYLNTCSYLVAPTLVPPSQKSRASGLMTVAFQSACFGALLLAAVIQQLKLGDTLAEMVGATSGAAAIGAAAAAADADAAAGAAAAAAAAAAVADAAAADVGGGEAAAAAGAAAAVAAAAAAAGDALGEAVDAGF
ncbi:hypothetical protein HYH02_003044 [Chlamydomonas schloesseri]|uniref:Uncharacterized protein n=1 Tax=Chlamydomonas schloesseri TaxID=2026947 RepID=A0A836B9R5_9CHLO|nr:hypothetical protein HYH02_003044 [Chlamydomonas schloesseri]|eukprot:KAG2452002.1 hypothetical protein HYH02_003044 [Chlamydomonas schloesseri]